MKEKLRFDKNDLYFDGTCSEHNYNTCMCVCQQKTKAGERKKIRKTNCIHVD